MNELILSFAAIISHLFILPMLGAALAKLVPALPRLLFKEL